jgi:hypothetical protein
MPITDIVAADPLRKAGMRRTMQPADKQQQTVRNKTGE